MYFPGSHRSRLARAPVPGRPCVSERCRRRRGARADFPEVVPSLPSALEALRPGPLQVPLGPLPLLPLSADVSETLGTEKEN